MREDGEAGEGEKFSPRSHEVREDGTKFYILSHVTPDKRFILRSFSEAGSAIGDPYIFWMPDQVGHDKN
jgi:hypothetical protein